MSKKTKPKKILPGESFMLGNTVYTYRIDEGGVIKLKMESQIKEIKAFVPPTREEVRAYFAEHGYYGADKFYNGYSAGEPPWSDRNGKPIRSWKQKAQQVWFEDRNKIPVEAPKTGNQEDDKYSGMSF